MVFIILLIVLILFVTAFVAFIVWSRRMNLEKFRSLNSIKIERFAKNNNLPFLTNLTLSNYQRERLNINHIIFGKKYIYLISDFLLKGFISGEAKDNSWLYFNNIKKSNHYLDNLYMLSDKNIQDFAGILSISSDPIVSLCLVPNECDFNIKNAGNKKEYIVHYSSLLRLIRKMEKEEIASLNEKQIYEQYQFIKERNNEGKGNNA